jgi:hypothetical protein
MPPPLTPTPAGEATAFPIYPNLKVKQGKHDCTRKKSFESNPKQKINHCLNNAIKNKYNKKTLLSSYKNNMSVLSVLTIHVLKTKM